MIPVLESNLFFIPFMTCGMIYVLLFLMPYILQELLGIVVEFEVYYFKFVEILIAVFTILSTALMFVQKQMA